MVEDELSDDQQQRVEDLRRQMRAKAEQEREEATIDNLRIETKKEKMKKAGGSVVIEDRNNLPSLMDQMQDIVEASVRAANAHLMDEARKVWETDNFNQWGLEQSTVERKRREGVDEPSKALYETGQLIASLDAVLIPDDDGVIGGLGLSGSREDSDLTNQELFDILTQGSPHDEKFTFMTKVRERTQTTLPERIQESLVENVSEFSGLK